MKNQIRNLLIITLVFTVSLVSAQKKNKKNKMTDWTSYDFSKIVKGKIPGPVRNKYVDVKRVYIADFVVEQQVFSKYSKTSYGGMSHGASTARMEANLGGIDYKTYQETVAKLYDEVANYYIEQGYEIVSAEEVMQTELYKNMDPGKRIVAANASDLEPVRFGDGGLNKYVCVRPSDKMVVYADAKKDVLLKGAVPWKVYFKLANELNALVISYKFKASFVDMSGKGGYFATSAKVSAQPYMSVWNGVITVLAPSKKTTQPTTASFYQEEQLEGNNNGWITPEGFKKIDESGSSYYWSGSSNKKVENVMMVNSDPFVEEISNLTGGLSLEFSKQLIENINK